MLKALEISGFKSFADKTRFEFPPGITVVVGPNGSGKSNIVDAIKWVLGEQSAKSLRGKEMSDVIFKGSSGAGARRPANAASATIILDNSDGRFAYDSDEVHVGRRVYRSGESEYLVNGETARLKDIKNLFRGTGVGTDAYSLIEQGKVDQLLQANAKDRRIIFEEAAGISRFKAKKVEAERRLARVEGNLIRLADIVEEVGKRYRSVKAQASKAARYKEYSDRLQQLRTFVGMKDWRTFSEKLEAITSDNDEFAAKSQTLNAEITDFEKRSREVEAELEKISEEVTTNQNQVSEIREAIAQSESKLTVNRSRVEDLAGRDSQLQEQIEKAEFKSKELSARIEKAESEFESAEINFRDSSDSLKALEAEMTACDDKILSLRTSQESNRARHAEIMLLVTEIGKLVSADDSQVSSLTESKSRYSDQLAELTAKLQTQRQQHAEFVAEGERLQQEAESKDGALAEARSTFEKTKSNLNSAREHLSELTSREAGLSQRAQVIEELEKKLEGINAGAKELLQQSKVDRTGPMSEVIGLVADLVSVNVQHAGIVDVALGEFAQYVVVDGGKLVSQLADDQLKLKGRVGIIQLDDPPSLGADPTSDFNGAQGVIGRADRLVQVQPPYQNFVRKLLGGTWIVKTLADGLHLHETRPKNARFVTLDGEIVEADGTVVVGPKSAATGLVSRRSELRALNRDLNALEDEIETLRRSIEELAAQEKESEAKVQLLISENSDLAKKLSNQALQADAMAEQIAATEKQNQQVDRDLTEATSKLSSLEIGLTANREKLASSELQITSLASLLSVADSDSSTAQAERNSIEKQATKAKVVVAKSEQQLHDLQIRLSQHQQEFAEHRTAYEQLKAQVGADSKNRETAEAEIKAAEAALEKQQADKETFEATLQQLTEKRSEVDGRRRTLAIDLKERRDELRSVDDKLNTAKLRIEQLNMQREQLAERMQEDYGIDIASVKVEEAESLSEEALAERDKVDSEITDLRKKIGTIGNVNLDALAELEQLESRYTLMDEQYQDLVQAKETLEKIIHRINADSRRLFVETLEAIRTNFQKLFRQTFGGGRADIVLEEGVDPLEAGVEIIATPPGKPQFNNSLLSGGEKALTAVSLLMAIFQFRPSPFCVLDEVDAPFDEANIGRFIDVLKSFLGWTKFVIVTHSKKTMTAATTLYGITMQESGVSKRVSVRFEDVSEDGHISPDAIDRAEDADEGQRGVA